MGKTKLGGGLSSGGLSELKKRLLAVVIGIIIFRFGAYIPVPGLSADKLQELFSHHSKSLLGLFNMFSGGALQRMTIFALSIMPYISASIVVQLYTSVSPQLKQLQKEGEQGRRKINQYTRYGTLFLSLLQGFGICKWLVSQHAVNANVPLLQFYLVGTVTLVTGTMFLMWLGEQMTERGVGNGISLIIFSGICARLPSAVSSISSSELPSGIVIGLVFVVLAAILVVIYFERAQRRITINYAKRQQGRKMYAAQSSYLPLKINASGVIPPIFAQSILLFPVTLAQFFGTTKGLGWLNEVNLWFGFGSPGYMVLYTVMVIFFAFFYTALVFNPKETADNLKKSGAFIPGIRPGEQTAQYVDGVTTRLTLVGSIYLAAVCLLPQFFIVYGHVPFYFGGTSLLIMVVVIMDTMAQVQAHLMSHQYESLMRKSKNKGSKMGLIR